MSHQPHPYALMLPPLTDEEYAALKADVAAHGVLYPVIVDEDGLVLDGVHRCRIAAELGVELPVSRLGHLDEDRKLHLAVGLNMRRRHLDADRRRELVRRLNRDEGLSVRRIAAVTGWSKSTVDRDLKASPFEVAVSETRKLLEHAQAANWDDSAQWVVDATRTLLAVYQRADAVWKRGEWPPPLEEHAEMTFATFATMLPLDALLKVRDMPKDEREAFVAKRMRTVERFDAKVQEWDGWTAEQRRAWAESRRDHFLPPAVPDGTGR